MNINPLFHPIRYRIIKLLLMHQLMHYKEVARELDIDEEVALFHLAGLELMGIVQSEFKNEVKLYSLNWGKLLPYLEDARQEIERIKRNKLQSSFVGYLEVNER